MAPRIARSSVSVAAPKTARNKAHKRNLDAYSIASHSTKDPRRVPQHRLGQVVDDAPAPKRRRTQSDDEDDGEAENAPKSKRVARGPDGDDGVEQGSDSEGNEWTLGGLGEDDEDSDLNSDEAFGESDEEKFEGFAFRGSTSGKTKRTRSAARAKERGEGDGTELDLYEGDDGDDFGDEGVDLATMLDDDAEDGLVGPGGEDSADDEDEYGSESESDSAADEDDEDEANDEERIARMRDRVEAMDPGTSRSSAPTRNETSVLSLNDLLADVDPAARKQLATSSKKQKKSSTTGPLTAPLPKRRQDLLNREVATKQAKAQLDRWRDTVIHNRRAEFLTFPLVDPDRGVPIGKDKFVTQDLVPQNELEVSIRRILEESGMAATASGEAEDGMEEAIMKGEELATNPLPVEEVLRRRAELRRRRDLLFREEVKAKRIAKIKSKRYRRVHRRERERERQGLAALGGELSGEEGEDERERSDRKRAEARMGTKHRDSTWAKSLKATNQTVWDEGARDSVLEQARRQEELRKRMVGDDVSDAGSERSDVPSVGEDSDGSDGEEDGNATTLRQLSRLEKQDNAGHETGLSGMKFMRAAEGRRRLRNEEDVERLRKEMAVADGDEADSEEEAEEEEGLGRAIFGPKSKGVQRPQRNAKPEMEEGNDSERDEQDAPDVPAKSVEKRKEPKSILKKRDGASGPLAKAFPLDRRDPEAFAKDAPSSWLTAPEARKKSKTDRQRERAENGIVLDVSQQSLTAEIESSSNTPRKPLRKQPSKSTSTASPPANVAGWTTVPHTNDMPQDDHLSDSDHTSLSAHALQDQKSIYFQRAFAGDDTQSASFAASKAAAAISEDEQEVSTHLPGWGSWTGFGLSRSIQRANKKARHNPLFKTKLPGGVKPEDRVDSKLENVMVSEKRDRKGTKFLAPMLPHGFETKAQYEGALRLPVGPEWTTKEVFQRQTRPRVVVRPGRVVEAMERPMV